MSRARDLADRVLHNRTHEDTDGGRESIVTFKGEQSGGEISTLAQIQASHDGTSDDEKADLIFKTNDGSDGASPTERVRIDSNGSIITSTLGTNNTHLGEGAAASIVSGGNNNTAIGTNAGTAITTGDKNTALGVGSLQATTTSGENTGIGYNALTSATGDGNVALGYGAGANATTTDHSTLIGFEAGGNGAMTGHDNTYLGMRAGYGTTVAEQNVAIGRQALSTDDVPSRCVAIGHAALINQNAAGSGVNAMANTSVGWYAGGSTTTGYYNTFLGYEAGYSSTTGERNVCIGMQVDTTGSNSIAIGTGFSAVSNDFSFGKAGNVVSNDFDSDAAWSRSSDSRLKTNVNNASLGLDFVNDLRPVTYQWKASQDLDSEDSQLSHLYDADENKMNITDVMHGFIAQEVKAALDTAGVDNFKGWKEDQYGVQQISREMFVIPLVKAVQELSAKVDALETENTAIKARLDALEA